MRDTPNPKPEADPLYEILRAGLLACPDGCSCRGRYTGPERRKRPEEDTDDHR